MAFPHSERDRTRAALKNIADIRDTIEDHIKKQQPIPKLIAQRMYALTNGSEPMRWIDALNEFYDQMDAEFDARLLAEAPNDLTAYIEFINREEPPPRHIIFLCDWLMKIERREILRGMISMPPGHAKALAIDTPIRTTDGWTTIGQLKIGDYVFGPDGLPTEVTAKSEIFEGRKCYRVTTDDGQSVVADEDHLWTVRKCRKRKVFKTAKTRDLFTRQGRMRDLRIPMLPPYNPIVLPESDLPIDPYVFGYWLGDGHSSGAIITVHDDDAPNLIANAPEHSVKKNAGKYSYGFTGLHTQLNALGVLKNKHIPAIYLNAGVNQRRALLQGLMDSDGTVSPEGQCSFTNTNVKIFEGFSELLYSLGIKHCRAEERAVLYGKDCGPVYRTSFYANDVFRLERKAARNPKRQFTFGRYITIEETESVPTQCITVAREDGLFLAGRGMLVTHNSNTASRAFSTWYMGRNPNHKYLQGGHTFEFVKNQFGKKCRDIIDTERYRKVFPNVRLSKNSSAADYWALEGCKGEYMTRGAGQGISGIRANCIGIDDPYASKEDAYSPTIRQKIYDWYVQDVYTRLLPNSPLFLVATRWHVEDLLGVLEQRSKSGEGEKYDVINLPALCMDAENDPIGRKKFEALWPEFFTKEALFRTAQTLGNLGFLALYQGIPKGGKNSEVSGWFQRFKNPPKRLRDTQLEGTAFARHLPRDANGNIDVDKLTPALQDQLMAIQQQENSKRRAGGDPHVSQAVKTVTISVDCANKVTERADYTVIGVWYETFDGRHFLVHVIRDKFEFNVLVDVVEKTARSYGADLILIEDAGAGVQYIQTRRHKAPCPVIPVSVGKKSKEFRFDGVMPLIEGGLVYLPDDNTRYPWLTEYEAEIASFPDGANDDQVDMTSQYLARYKLSLRRGTRKLLTDGSPVVSKQPFIRPYGGYGAGDLEIIKRVRDEERPGMIGG